MICARDDALSPPLLCEFPGHDVLQQLDSVREQSGQGRVTAGWVRGYHGPSDAAARHALKHSGRSGFRKFKGAVRSVVKHISAKDNENAIPIPLSFLVRKLFAKSSTITITIIKSLSFLL